MHSVGTDVAAKDHTNHVTPAEEYLLISVPRYSSLREKGFFHVARLEIELKVPHSASKLLTLYQY